LTEIWKDVSGYEGLYQVSNFGRVKRFFKNGKENFLAGKKDKDGYIEVILSSNQRKKYCRLHRLVADAFIPNLENKPQINHKDRNKQNNSADNLEWVTVSENAAHTFATGRKIHRRPVVQYARNMDVVSIWDSIRAAGNALKISEHNINSCCNGKLPTAGGFVWRYKEVDV
jgi:hypothetical protein